LATILAGVWMSGCGSSGAANQVVVNVTGTASVMVPTQTQTIIATVTGATDVSSTFDCSYTTTPNPTTASAQSQAFRFRGVAALPRLPAAILLSVLSPIS